MFMDVWEVMGPAPADLTAEPAGAALQRLNALHKSIGTAVGKESGAMAKIFPDASAALAAFVTRIFEQRLKVTVISWSLTLSTGQEAALSIAHDEHAA